MTDPRTYTLGAIIGPDGELSHVSREADENYTWQVAFRWPTLKKLDEIKTRGYRYARLTAREEKNDE